MKITFISFLSLLICLNADAQSNFYKLSLGAGYGPTQSFTDVKKHGYDFAGYGTADYFFTPFLSLGGELQMGQIRGGDVQTDPHEREFINKYKAASINGKIYLGALIDYDRSSFARAVKWFYVGAGAGIVHNNVNRVTVKPSTVNSGNPYVFPGKNSSNDLMVPLNVGINFYFPDFAQRPRFGININYQTNVTLGEGLDGYDDSPIIFKNGNPDIYTYFSIGLRYNFGFIGLSSKSLY
ncbi:outer membrane beta-barrel protein [Pedobacter frigoris]|uniref:Outer membrane protein beta-barrel domain-containing protein n=1 Tax=Pedobacter frigoris TaxID=2571272 RepID=A0A4U1CG97_9SPHI|nr:outer membrane beta-barrel protein [Pedobacter frigoris]TKC04852.1 hypothetical protein FA047_13840 [Pedobacter frigoris]